MSFALDESHIYYLTLLLGFLNTNGIPRFACYYEHKLLLERFGAILDGLEVFKGEFFSFEDNFSFFLDVDLALHRLYEILAGSGGFDSVRDDLIGEILNVDKGMEFLFRMELELNKLR